MSEITRIKDQLQRALDGDAWCGAPIMTALEGVTPMQALRKPISGAHTIWEIVLHVITWIEEPLLSLDGKMRQMTEELNWPPTPEQPDEAGWKSDLERLRQTHARLVARLDGVDDNQLDAPIAEGFDSIYVIMHGVVQHILYHSAQIMILKKS